MNVKIPLFFLALALAAIVAGACGQGTVEEFQNPSPAAQVLALLTQPWSEAAAGDTGSLRF